MKKIQTILSICYHVEAIKASLETLLKQPQLVGEINVIENPSVNTEEIKPYILDLMKKGFIKKYILTDRNVTHHATKMVLTDNLIDIVKTEYILITNGNISCKDSSWLDKEINLLEKYPKLFMCAVPISLENMPEGQENCLLPMHGTTEDYDYGFTGKHMLFFRSKEFKDVMDETLEDGHFRDADIHKYLVKHGKTCAVLFEPQFHRHTWDLYKDPNNEYVQKKEKYTLEELWAHDEYCGYTVYQTHDKFYKIIKYDKKNFIL